MFKITSDGATCYADEVRPIRLLDNGTYGLCDLSEAEGFCAPIPTTWKDDDGNTTTGLADTVYAFEEGGLTGAEPQGSYTEVSGALTTTALESTNDVLNTQLTQTQVALCDVYEMVIGG